MRRWARARERHRPDNQPSCSAVHGAKGGRAIAGLRVPPLMPCIGEDIVVARVGGPTRARVRTLTHWLARSGTLLSRPIVLARCPLPGLDARGRRAGAARSVSCRKAP